MTTLYWALEYTKVLFAYAFIFFVWPLTIFNKRIKDKSLTFKIAFCSVAMPVIISTVVLGLGLFHLLHKWIIVVLFYGLFLYRVYQFFKGRYDYMESLKRIVTGTYGSKTFLRKVASIIAETIKRIARRVREIFEGHVAEYVSLIVLVIFGVIYFSYGAFQDYSYGFGDMYTHNSWIYGLMDGRIFSSGIYPEGMHCVVYAISVLFGIRVYSVLLFLQGIHSVIYLLSAYILFKEIFRYRFSPQIALALFLMLDLKCIDQIYSMSRLQWTLPQEFALYTPFLCAAFFVRYIKSDNPIVVLDGERKTKIFRVMRGVVSNEDMLVFSLAIATSFVVHFYTTFMAIFVCVAFVPVVIKKVFSPKNFAVLATMAVLGIFIALVPMVGAFASGIPLQGSIGWAMSIINGTENDSQNNMLAVDENGEEIADLSAIMSSSDSDEGPSPQLIGEGPVLPRIYKAFSEYGYFTLYDRDRGMVIIILTAICFVFFVLYRIIATIYKFINRYADYDESQYDQYLSLILATVVLVGCYCSTFLGLPSLVAGSRLGTIINMHIMALCVLPFDAIMSFLKYVPKRVLDIIGVVAIMLVYIGTRVTGTYHSYLYYELTRYNSAVMTTYKITDIMPKDSFTIVSTVDELYQQIDYGFHEELVTFVNKSEKDDYTIPTEYVFIYVEKHPIKYAQFHFFDGPKWLGNKEYIKKYGIDYISQCPYIKHTTASPELSRPPFDYIHHGAKAYNDMFSRTVLESHIKEWCREFSDLYPDEMHVFYEDDDFVCYYFRQNPSCLFQLAFQSAYPENNAKGIFELLWK